MAISFDKKADPFQKNSHHLLESQSLAYSGTKAAVIAAAAAQAFLGPKASDVSTLIPPGDDDISLDALDEAAFTARASMKEIGIDPRDPEVDKAIHRFVTMHTKAYLASLKPGETRPVGDDALLRKTHDWLTDSKRAKDNQKSRLEYRRILESEPNNVANIAMCFANGNERDAAFQSFKDRSPSLSIVSAGSTTLEIGNIGVDKATANIYVAEKFMEMTRQSGYTKGPLIDARLHKTFLSLDGDGTLWEKPQADISPLAFHLGVSPTQLSILDYLRAGGVLMINSGNDPQRTVDRLLHGIPPHERKDLLTRIFIAASGGHALFTLDAEGKIQIVENYQTSGKTVQQAVRKRGTLVADYMYMGDDPKVLGNDYAAFKQAGDHFVCVANEIPKDADPEVINQETIVPGETHGVRAVVKQVLEQAKLKIGFPLFRDPASVRSASRKTPAAEAVISETLRLLNGRGGVNELIHYSDQRINAPVVYSREKIEDLTASFADQRKSYTCHTDPAKIPGGKTSVKLNFETLLSLNNGVAVNLRNKGKNPADYVLTNNLGRNASFEESMEKTLDGMHLENGSVVRILEPGNNDQSTPMFVSQQIKYIQKYAERKGLNLNIQVIVMGKGGHASTAQFPQFAQVKGKDFSGVQEAISLGSTLIDALNESNIKAEFVERFSESTGAVQIKLAKDSTNTGLNVQEAIEAYNGDTVKPRHVLVTSATASSTRQAQTFAHQYSSKRGDPEASKLYDSITAIPLPRSAGFVETSLTDHQAVTEMYAGLAERARIYLYAYDDVDGGPFIPPSIIDKVDLEDLYRQYDLLSGTNHLEVSKSKTMKEVLKFFQDKFTIMEESIPWNKEIATQLPATKNSMREMAASNQLTKRFHASLNAYHTLKSKGKKLPEEKRVLRIYKRLLHMYRHNAENVKKSCAWMMGNMISMLQPKVEVFHV